jgi:hypothetical protein
MVSVFALLGCAGERKFARGAYDPSLDTHVMGFGLDKDDVQRALHVVLDKLRASAIMRTWRENGGVDPVAVVPFRNQTSVLVDAQLNALLSETETWLVQSGAVRMVSQERQLEMAQRLEASGQAERRAFFRYDTDVGRMASFGRRIGVRYYVTGKLQAVDETFAGARRVQYWLFLQVLESETSNICFQEKAEITKMLQ